MAQWAFGTSTTGLGLTETYLWSLTPREFSALRDQWQQAQDRLSNVFASIQSTLYNAHFRGPGDAAYLATDFLGKTDWDKRQAEVIAQRKRDAIDLMKARAKLAAMKSNQEVEGIPEWAKR